MLRPRNAGAEQAGPGPAHTPAGGDTAGLVAAAQAGDGQARECLIREQTPLVLRVASRLCGRYLRAGRDDEVSIGLIALNEAVDHYRAESGASFPSFAEMVVRRRLIDHFRREGHRRETPFSEFEREDGEASGGPPLEFARALEVERDQREQQDRRAEIELFQSLLRPYGVTLADLLRQSPQHADARLRAVAVARAIAENREWAEHLRTKHALPLRQLEERGDMGVSRKTVERQRKFIIAVAVILMEGLQALRGYLPTA